MHWDEPCACVLMAGVSFMSPAPGWRGGGGYQPRWPLLSMLTHMQDAPLVLFN